jgi:hypothetical protein
VSVNSAGTQITATSPAESAGTVDVTVTTPGGTSATSSADDFTYVAAPTVSSVSPTSGPTTGGTQVTITGTNLSGATAVDFGSTPAASFTAVSSTEIDATSPAYDATVTADATSTSSSGAVATVNVTVTTPGGTSATSSADQFSYESVAAVPTVTSVSPDTGPDAGGTQVTIEGSGFTDASAVDFGTGNPATAFTVVSADEIDVTSPAGSGTVDVTVSTPAGTSATSSADQFTYAPAPVITSVQPTSGSTSGGTTVTITGTGLGGALAVYFNTTQAQSFSQLSDTEITAVSPAGSPGTVDITVVTENGFNQPSAADEFTYVQPVPAPTVSSVSPSSGSTAGGTQVTITGTNLSGATAVDFGSVAATGVSVNSAGTQITATSPAGSAGTVDVTVTTAGGTSKTSSADEFTYVAPVVVAPKLSAISPSSGSKAGGTQVTITGTNLSGATAVDFGSVAATGVSVNSAGTQITATSPAGSAGTVDVTVTTAGGTSNGLAYTYTAPPTASAPQVTDLFPRSGSVQGYALVWVFGKNFTNVTGVTFGSTKALYRDFGPELLVALAPPASEAGTVDVRVTTQAGGTSPVSSADQYTYQKEMCFLFFCFG